MNKAVFFDRDGTINVEKNYLYKIEDFEFLPGAIDGMRMLQDVGYKLIIITNQSGIARGYYTEEDFRILNDWMLQELQRNGVGITHVYYCPHHPYAKIEQYRIQCDCRKPFLGLFEQAIRDYEIDLNGSYSIGDKIRDCAICHTTDCKGILIGINENEKEIDTVKDGKYKNIRYAENLLEASKIIVEASICI